jgi:hypothetical protein
LCRGYETNPTNRKGVEVMSKSILVIDTVDRCWDCELKKSCKVIPRNQSGSKWNTIHPQCPLQPVAPLLELVKQLEVCASDRYDSIAYKISNKLKQALGGNEE